MKGFLFACGKSSLLLFVLQLSGLSEVSANPGSYGMQMCSMMRSGTSQRRAWDYIIQQHTMQTGGQMGGFGIAAGVIAGQQLRDMRGDVFAVARANCPEAFGGGSARPARNMPESYNKNHPSYCSWNPWEEECKNGGIKQRQLSNACSKVLEKYDCKYMKYLDANPHMKDWVKANPAMARKEALRLKAIDASEIGIEPILEETAPTKPEKSDAAETCLKALDYKGCMEYNNQSSRQSGFRSPYEPPVGGCNKYGICR